MNRKALLIGLIIVVIILTFPIGYSLLEDNISFFKNKKEAIQYVETVYNNSVKFVSGNKGDSPWSRTRVDKFVFQDKNEGFFFTIYCTDGNISDCYQESFLGNQISTLINNHFENKPYDFLVETVVYNDKSCTDNYSDTYCSMVVFTHTQCIDSAELFDILNYLICEFPAINISLRISDVKYKEDYNRIFSYEENFSLDSIPFIYRGAITNSKSIELSQIEMLLKEWEF